MAFFRDLRISSGNAGTSAQISVYVYFKVRKVVASSNFSVTTTEEDEEPSSPSSSSAVNAQWIANVTLGWQEKLFSPKEETFYQKAKEEDFQVQ